MEDWGIGGLEGWSLELRAWSLEIGRVEHVDEVRGPAIEKAGDESRSPRRREDHPSRRGRECHKARAAPQPREAPPDRRRREVPQNALRLHAPQRLHQIICSSPRCSPSLKRRSRPKHLPPRQSTLLSSSRMTFPFVVQSQFLHAQAVELRLAHRVVYAKLDPSRLHGFRFLRTREGERLPGPVERADHPVPVGGNH